MKIGLFAIALTAFAAAGFAPLNEDAVGLQGSYTVAPSADLRACASACEADGLCMSWAYSTDGQCAMSAVTPTSGVTPGLTWGLASRASRFEWQPAAPAPSAEEADATAPAREFRNPFEPLEEKQAPADTLLGGPAGPDGLRLRFAEERATTP
ncbi:MAG: hypothetical protein JNJ73_00310 [Hyphomonadaceae bacterium]|nr:hypothetical protein [Hyphomonadaceae bacterium]